MQTYEVGVLPQSKFFFFSPTKKKQGLFYHLTMCGHFFCTSEYYIKRDSFPPLLLVYTCSGSFHLELDGKKYSAGPGQILFFDCRQPHHYYADGPLEFLYAHFDGPKAHELCRYIGRTTGVLIDSVNNGKIEAELRDMIRCCEEGTDESPFAASERIYRIMSMLENTDHSPRVQKNDEALTRVIQFIRSHIGERITLHQMAELAGLSDYYFAHLFKEMTGLSPASYVIYSRIDMAKSMLITTELPVAEISARVGYPNSSNLISIFTQRVGCTPGQFREQNVLRLPEQKTF